MGQPKGGGTSSGGGGGGGSSAPKKKKDNGTSKYFKSTSKPVAKTPSAKTLAEQYGLKGAGEAAAKTKAVATPAAKATPKKTVKAKPPAAPKVSVIKAPTISAAPAAKIEAAPAKESFGVLKSDTAAKRDTTSATFIKDITKRAIPKAITSISEPDALSAKPKVDAASVREKAYEKAAEPKAATSIPPLIAKPTVPNYVEKALTPEVKPDLPVDKSVYEKVAAGQKDGGLIGKVSPTLGAVISDKYRNEDMSYNQAYWASRKAGGATQAEMAAEQKAIGMKKAYSGDVVVTESMKREAAEAMKPVKGEFPELLTKGVRTVDKETSGLFGEHQKKTLTYGDGAVITSKTTDPVIKTPLGELRLGDKKTTTYANGVEQYTQTGGDKYHVGAEVAGAADKPSYISDTTKIEPMDGLNTVSDVQNAIASTTDEKELASLHERLRSLMRAMRTRTKFGGLAIGQAETEATKLGGLRIK